MKDVKIVVASCDKNSDCWEPWEKLKQKYWTKERAALITETTRYDRAFDTIPVQATTWTERMKKALEKIAEPFVIFMCDDHFIREPVSEIWIGLCRERLQKGKRIATFNFECAYRETRNIPVLGGRFDRQIKGQIYNFSCQPSIWRRTALIECLDVIEGSPWEWELTEERTAYEFMINTGEPIINVGYRRGEWMGIRKGRWVRDDMAPLNEKEQLGIDLSIRGTC